MAFQYILCDTMHRLSIEGLLRLLQQRKDCCLVHDNQLTKRL